MKVWQLAQNEIADHVIICGDFNLVLNPSLDCHNYTNINNLQARSKVMEMMNSLDLIDSFRYLNNNVKRFSWRKKSPLKQARLDYFLTSNTMVDMIDSCDINQATVPIIQLLKSRYLLVTLAGVHGKLITVCSRTRTT